MKTGTQSNTTKMYKETKQRLAVVSFLNGKRKLTYSGLSLDQAMMEVSEKSARGMITLVCVDLPDGIYSNNFDDYKDFSWK